VPKNKTVLHVAKKRKNAESKPTQCRDCAWWPFCTESAENCNGYKKKDCKVYGEGGGLLAPPDMNTKDVDQARNNRQKLQQKISKKQKNISGDGRRCRTLPLPNDNFATVLSDGNAVVLSDTIRIPGPVTSDTG
jgi:hypothetical protein